MGSEAGDMVSGFFANLKDGTVAADKIKGAISSAVRFCKKHDFDQSLIQSLPAALPKAPSDRGSFDVFLWGQLDSESKALLARLAESIASGTQANTECIQKVETAKRELESAQANSEVCQNNLKQCQVDVKEAEVAHSKAGKAVAQLAPEMKALEKELAAAKSELAALAEGPLKVYKDVLEFTPQVASAAAQEEAPAAE